MGEKDIAEKTLEAYNEVFADIVNVLLFKGEQIILPEDLVDQTPRSMYKADDRIRELERDVAKRWVKNNIRIACIGLENQSSSDRWMPLRIMGYDGLEYRSQLRDLKEGDNPCPVVTLVLYFGYANHWNAPTTLLEALDVPDILKPWVSDVKVNLFEIAYLSWDQVNKFRSDFREVARFFVQMRENGEYIPSNDELDHIQAVLQLLNVFDKDRRFETAANDKTGAKEVRTMSEWLTNVINKSEATGYNRGIEQGIEQGIERGIEQGIEKGRISGNEEGKIRTLWGLVIDQLLDMDVAADRAQLSVAEFQKQGTALMGEPVTEYISHLS